MANKKISVSLDPEQLAAVRKLVDAHVAESVSGFVQHAVAVALNDVAGWGAMLGEALEQSGGPLTKKERAWADSFLRPARGVRRRRSAA